MLSGTDRKNALFTRVTKAYCDGLSSLHFVTKNDNLKQKIDLIDMIHTFFVPEVRC